VRIDRSDLTHCTELSGAVVVIDVLRSFTTAAVALAGGARELILPSSPAAARELKAADPTALMAGAMGGGAVAPGFDVGNSPSALRLLPLHGRRVLLSTAGGTRGVIECDHAGTVLAAALINAGATARLLRWMDPPRVTLVVTGMWSDRDGDEDHACADLIEALLCGSNPPRDAYVERVRASDFGRRFSAGNDPHLPPSDLDFCAAVDLCDFAMRVEPHAHGRRLIPVWAAEGAPESCSEPPFL
jgi:2-phosphosulfolactate phosphatase